MGDYFRQLWYTDIFFVYSDASCFLVTSLLYFICYIIRFFSRIVLCLLGVLTLVVIDLVGHSMKSNSSSHTQCMFQVYRIDIETLEQWRSQGRA